MRPAWCEINLDNLRNNYKAIKKIVGEKVELMPVIKADAYGHGAVECAKKLVESGANRFAVAIVDEAIQLRKAGINCPILILGYIPKEDIPGLLKWDLTPTIYNVEFAKELSRRASKEIKVHIKIDTGMSRLGFKGIDESVNSVEKIFYINNICIEGIYSHFATSDERSKDYSYEQIKKFDEVVGALDSKGIRIPLIHFSNSAGIIDLPGSYYNCVRPGIVLYGLYPSEEVNKANIELQPVKSFKTKVSNINRIARGESVSYGRTYIAERERTIATIAVGYGDGYTRLLSNKGEVLIKGQRAKIVGNVCMDQCMVDVTHIPEVEIGDEVLLYGSSLPIEEVASWAGTINYEITCMTKARVPILYFQENKVIKLDNFLCD